MALVAETSGRHYLEIYFPQNLKYRYYHDKYGLLNHFPDVLGL